MEDRANAKSSFERRVSLFTRRPSSAIRTSELKVRLRYGQPDEIEGRGCKIVGNTFQFEDGETTGVGPGFLGLAAIGLCLAKGYMVRLAHSDIEVNGIEVSLQATNDTRRAYGISDDIPAGYQTLHCHVEVDSEVDEGRILAIIDDADGRSPWLGNFTQPHTVTRDVRVMRGEAAE